MSRSANVLVLCNKGWGITAKVVVTGDIKYRVDVYSGNEQKLSKSLDCRNLREALIKACDIVGED